MLAHLLENYFIGVSLAEICKLNAPGKTEFEDDQHYCEHLLALAKALVGAHPYTISTLLETEFAQGMPLAGHESEAMLIRAGFVGLYRNGRPWNEDAVKNLVLAGQTEDRYLIAAAWTTVNIFSCIMQTNEGAQRPLNAKAILFEVQHAVRRCSWPQDAGFEEITTEMSRYFVEFMNGNRSVDDVVSQISQIGGTAGRPLRSVLNAIIIGVVNDDAADAALMAQHLTPDDIVTAALASAFSATSRIHRPGMKQLLSARSIFCGTDGGNKQYDERELHLKLVIDGIERRRKYLDDNRGRIIHGEWWAYDD